ncbi:hypothetical protein FACS1894184_13920 [Clostridia bacterium]|nr:hypothetical protein FACS1894184_13920 [Clostridia bacterium]
MVALVLVRLFVRLGMVTVLTFAAVTRPLLSVVTESTAVKAAPYPGVAALVVSVRVTSVRVTGMVAFALPSKVAEPVASALNAMVRVVCSLVAVAELPDEF